MDRHDGTLIMYGVGPGEFFLESQYETLAITWFSPGVFSINSADHLHA